MKILIMVAIASVAWAAVDSDLIPKVPVPLHVIQGYPDSFNTSVYSGYLDVQNSNRSMHYVFV